MGSETAWGFVSLIALVAFIGYALYQGTKVKKPPRNVPQDRSWELTRWSDPRQD